MPVQTTVRIKGQDIIISGLKRAKLTIANLPADVIRPEMEAAADEIRNYPPELPNQRYIRTGKRGERTRVEAYTGNNQYSKAYTVVSDPTYAGRSADPYVIGDAEGKGQARIHAGAGRWPTLKAAVDRALERIKQAYSDVLDALAAGF